ncbi:MAG: hypothetical protein RJA57_867 [Bacteroidota bacterium]
MKTLLLAAGLIIAGGFYKPATAQPCQLANPGVVLTHAYPNQDNTACIIGIDLYFDMTHNPGGKYVWAHIWPTALYTDHNYGLYGPPTLANGGLVNSVATFGFFHQGSSLIMQTTYPPDANAPGFQSDLIPSENPNGLLPGSDRYTIKGLDLTSPGTCQTPLSFTADIWESQSASAQNVHCVVKGMTFYANDPRVNGLIQCSVPRQYRFWITSVSPASKLVRYKIAIDDGNGIYNPIDDSIVVKHDSVTVSTTSPYYSTWYRYAPYDSVKPYADQSLWVIALKDEANNQPNDIYALVPNSCTPLPVTWHSFIATRKNEQVRLSWETASEQLNRGFFIERSTAGTNNWQSLAFVPSAAPNGSSDALLSYSWTEINTLTGVSHYRLRQVDQDNRTTYSEVRAVPGPEKPGKVWVAPNPSPDGRFTLLLQNMEGENQISLIDMSGRVLYQWVIMNTNRLSVGPVPTGMYTLSILQRNTGVLQHVKVMISN